MIPFLETAFPDLEYKNVESIVLELNPRGLARLKVTSLLTERQAGHFARALSEYHLVKQKEEIIE
jgi:hypothetical protein